MGVRGLPTHFGTLDLTLCMADEDRLRVGLGGSVRPPGGIVLQSPLARPVREVDVDGRAFRAGDPRRVRLREPPAVVVLRY